MRINSLVAGALMTGVLTMPGFSQTNGALARMHVATIGPAGQDSTTHFNVYLPLTHQDALEQLLRDQTDSNSPSYHQWLTPAQFKAQFGPSPSDMAKATAALRTAGFTVVGEKTQNLEVEGPVSAVEKMFATHLQLVQTEQGVTKFASAEEHLTMPSALASLGAVIPEFTTHLVAHVHSARGPRLSDVHPSVRLGSTDSFYYADDMREAYQVPSFTAEVEPPFSHRPVQLDGAGATIGIVIASVISPTDLDLSFNSTISAGVPVDVQAYSAHTKVPVPKVVIDPVEGGSGPFNPDTGDAAEASLDTQMSLGTAPGAHEILYNLPELNDATILAGYTQVDEENRVDVVTSSFGECELDFTAAANGGTDFTGILKTFHALFQQGNSQGITFVASSGDSGGVPCLSVAFDNNPVDGTNFVAGVEDPASDPNVTGVGGTNLQTIAKPGPNDSAYLSENADFDPLLPAELEIGSNTVTVGNNTWGSGGGYSIVFPKPAYQLLVNTGSNRQRSVPDLALMMGGCPENADLTVQDCTTLPRSASIVWIGGEPNLLIGTSSAAPQFAAVLALAIEENGGRLGNVNPLIYALGALQTAFGGVHAPEPFQYFHRGISGSNNFFTVTPGQAYSEVLGNGTLEVNNFLLVPQLAVSGAPDTASNP